VWLARSLLAAVIAAIAVDVRPALTLERVWSQPLLSTDRSAQGRSSPSFRWAAVPAHGC
jgi:hypothetical protein